MYDSYTMRRTQVYLDEKQVMKLRSVARAAHRTMSELIREAIDEKLARPAAVESLDRALQEAMGIWAGREDLGTTDDYIRELRRDRRGAHR
jgi:Arc/MetJ-type ribon-helix-helix transcriptional regulator